MKQDNITETGGIMIGGDMDMVVDDMMSNSDAIRVGGRMKVDAARVINSGSIQAKRTEISARAQGDDPLAGDIQNTGSIQGTEQLSLTASRDLMSDGGELGSQGDAVFSSLRRCTAHESRGSFF